ncbi:MAG: hypothetical protein K6F00_01895 [Lachnospiraceae bacterium]|nr:hypothetical protein [Lachnospiraceae bacterium]
MAIAQRIKATLGITG